MASSKIEVPDYDFTGIYYPEIVVALRAFGRVNAPEITSEEPEEPFIQLERAFALVGHQSNVLTDFAAGECLVPTLRLQDSARQLLRLIDYNIRDYAPAVVPLLVELSAALGASTTVLEAYATFETDAPEGEEPVPFERIEALTVGPTDVVDSARGVQTNRASASADGSTVSGEAAVFRSPTIAATSADVGRFIRITGSTLGNNGFFEILEVPLADRVRLGGAFGSDNPIFLPEGAVMSWTIYDLNADGAAALNGVGTWAPWGATTVAGDAFYLCSSHVLFDAFEVTLSVAAAGLTGVWEYHDPDEEDVAPDDVTNLGTTLRLGVDGLLGTDDRRDAFVRVTYLPTGQSELLPSSYDGVNGNHVVTSAFVGQSGTPSTDVSEYAVGTLWRPFGGESDGTSDLTVDGEVTYTLPQTTERDWSSLSVGGVEGWWLRYRVVSVVAPTTAPTLDAVDLTVGTQYLVFDATQGETVVNEPTVSSNGRPSQSFELSRTPGLRDSVQTFVDEGGGDVEWTNVTALGRTLVTSASNDRHFQVDQNSSGVLTVVFGDGTRGRIPPLGVDNVRFVYRIDAVDDGNVGAGTVTVNADGSSFVASVTNPRPGTGWREAEGASEASLALLKETGPASLRTLQRATAPQDYVTLAVDFTASDGSKPVVRAKAIEEGFGPKTIKLVVVGANGTQISADVKSELEDYFNGNETTQVKGVGQANVEVTVVNYTPRLIDYTIVVRANSAVGEAAVRTAVTALISPTALSSDGRTYVWSFGGRVPNSRVASEVFSVSPGNVFDVDVVTPGVDQELGEVELPLVQSLTLTIVREEG